MGEPAFKVRHIRWWHKPVPLVAKHDDGYQQVGWAWNQWAYLVRNMHAGWVAYVENQTPENIDIWKCSHCGASIWATQRRKIEQSLKKD